MNRRRMGEAMACSDPRTGAHPGRRAGARTHHHPRPRRVLPFLLRHAPPAPPVQDDTESRRPWARLGFDRPRRPTEPRHPGWRLRAPTPPPLERFGSCPSGGGGGSAPTGTIARPASPARPPPSSSSPRWCARPPSPGGLTSPSVSTRGPVSSPPASRSPPSPRRLTASPFLCASNHPRRLSPPETGTTLIVRSFPHTTSVVSFGGRPKKVD